MLLSEDGRWADAVARAAAERGSDLTFVDVAVQGVEPAAFRAAYGVRADGATLVRPDGYVARRAERLPDDPAGDLTAALTRVSCAVRTPGAPTMSGHGRACPGTSGTSSPGPAMPARPLFPPRPIAPITFVTPADAAMTNPDASHVTRRQHPGDPQEKVTRGAGRGPRG